MTTEIKIYEMNEAEAVNAKAADDINRLLAQLSSTPHHITTGMLRLMTQNVDTHLFVAQKGADIVGMITVGCYSSPTGRKACIEDVVTDASVRGQGIGKALVQKAIAYLSTLSPCSVLLTSRPSRIVANALYQKLGFTPKETNVYTMKL